MTSPEHLKQLKQTTSLSPRRPRDAERYTGLRVRGSITASCEINKRKENEHD
jgi:hypothetical protein